MERSKEVTNRGFTILTFFFMIGTSILIAPAGLTQTAKQDAWIAAIVGIALNLGFVSIYVWLAERHNGQTFVGIGEKVLGSWIGRLLGGLFGMFCYLLAALMVGDMGYFLTSQILVDTPIEALEVMFACAIAITIRQGLKGYALAAEVFFPWIVLLFVLFVIPLLPDFDGRRLLPIMEYGPLPILKGGVPFFAFQELGVLLMIYPYVKAGKGRGKGFLIGTAIGGFVLVATTLGSLGVLASELTANHLYPVYTLAKNIKIGRFLERIEGIMIFIWICSIFIKITLTFHASLLAFSESLRIPDLRVFLWPLALGLVVLSLMSYPNVFYIQSFLSSYWLPFSSIFMVFLPLLYLAVSLLRGKKTA